MKRILLACLLIGLALPVCGKDFSSEILQVNSAGFPKIAVTLKVFSREPAELKSDNFVISEDGAGIASFELAFQQNRHYMILVIDRSSSIEPAMAAVKHAAAGFVQSMAGAVSMSILSFGSDIDFAHPFSADAQSLVAAINKIRPWGGTALYDALYAACEELQNKAGRADLKTVVCLTDGRDSTPNGQTPMSTHTPAEVNKFAVEKGIRLITVGLGNDIDESVLKGFSSATGGWYLQTTTPEQLSKIYEALGRRMKLERYYRLDYSTPKPDRDGTRRDIEITSRLQGLADQGKGYYIAPTVTVHKPEQSESEDGGKMSVKSVFHDLNIEGPDSVFLTGPIIPPTASPVFGLTRASLLGLDDAGCQTVIEQTRARIAAEHLRNYDNQRKYLEGYQQGLERIARKVEEWAANPGLKDFERPRIEYRRQYLQLRQEEIAMHLQLAYDEYQAKHTAAMDELDFYQRSNFAGTDNDGGFINTNSASLTAALTAIRENFYLQKRKHSEKMAQTFAESMKSRGSHVESTTTVVEEEIDLPGSRRRGPTDVGAVPSLGHLDKYIKNRIPGSDGDDAETDAYDGDDIDDAIPEMPELKILDR